MNNSTIAAARPLLLALALFTALMLTLAARADVPPVPETPAPITRLVEARPFTVDEPFVHHWRYEHTEFKAGWLLVLEVDPALVFPRQTEEPVLYVGDQTARRLNIGAESGHVVAIVPVENMREYKLDEQMIWFGSPAFPEQVDADRIAREKKDATDQGIEPLGAEALEEARGRADNASLDLTSLHRLMPEAGKLVEKHAPEDKSIAAELQGTKQD